MAFTIKVGSIYEKANEKGLAHFLEHMHMNFHVHNLYPEIRYVTKAYTDFFETIFYIKCNNDWENISKCLEILQNIAKGRFLDESYFDKTRNDVLSEILDYNKNRYMDYQLFSLLFKDSLYLSHLPIGKDKDISGISFEHILKFHKKFYLGNLMSIAIVGDIKDIVGLENHINNNFGDLKKQKVEIPHFVYKVPKYNDTIIHSIEIKDIKDRGFEVYFKIEKSKINDFHIIDLEVMERILFVSVEDRLKIFFKDGDIDINKIVCKKLDFDLFHMFYVIKIEYNDPRNETIEKIFHFFNMFFQDITMHIDESCIVNMIIRLKETLEKYKNNHYDSVGMNNLLLECINDFVLNETVYTYADKYKFFIDSIDKMNFELIYSYLNHWIHCDKIFIAKVLRE